MAIVPSSPFTITVVEGFDPSALLLWDKQTSVIRTSDSLDAALATAQSNDEGTGSGWTQVKAENGGANPWVANPPLDGELTPTRGAAGWIYTVDPQDVAEFAGVIPGFAPRAYCFEGWMAAYGNQGDYYLRFGVGDGVDEQVPGDVWFQFWYFCETSPTWNHDYGHPKFIYPNRGSYPAQAPNYDWLVTRHWRPSMPWARGVQNPENQNDHGERYCNFRHSGVLNGVPVMSYLNDYAQSDPGVASQIGQSYQGTPRLGAFETGRWTCMRLHLNSSQAAQQGNRCQLECYVRAYGSADWLLVSRWTHNRPPEPVDPDNGSVPFQYQLDGASNGYGHKQFVTPANTDATGLGQPAWAPGTAYTQGNIVVSQANPRGGNREYVCTAAGTSGTTEPNWNDAVDATTSDGSASWTTRRIFPQNQRYFLSDIAMVAGPDSNGPGAAALPDHRNYGY